jgi:hypothetical protein
MRALFLLLPVMALAGADHCLAAKGHGWRGHVPRAVSELNLPALGPLKETNRLTLAIGLPWRNQQSLNSLLRRIYDPSSPDFHHYLAPEEFIRRFAPTEQDYEAVIAFARANGLDPIACYSNRVLVDVRGSVSSIERALDVKINVYQHPREARTFYAPDCEPCLNLGSPVLHISGLDDYNRPHPSGFKTRPLGGTSAGSPLGGTGSGSYGSFTASDLRAVYVPGVSLTGTGQVVGLFELDGYYTNDIARYEQLCGLANPPLLQNLYLDNFNGSPTNTEFEVALDIEMAMAMAPGLAKIVVYEGGPSGIPDDILNCMATNNAAKQLSCSWSFDSDATTEQIFQEFAAQGQSFFAASGDSGAYTGGDIAPSDDPYITIVGGTTLATVSAGGAWASETAWNSGTGGISATYTNPTWQAGVDMSSNMGSATMRNFPDVSIVADSVGVVVENTGVLLPGYGTSASAPLWAGFIALANEQAAAYGRASLGFINPAIYAIGESTSYNADFHDITTGNNTNAASPDAYFAVPGYDLCTGWGTPNGGNLVNSLAPQETLVMLPVPGFASSGPAGGPFNVTTESFLLTNESFAALSWSLQCDAPWLSAWPASGTLNPGATASVAVNLNAAASNLFVGNYAALMTLTNLSGGLSHHCHFTLQISDPLTLSPAAGFEFAGPPSGPFNAAAASCGLTNAAQAAVAWSVAANPPWLNVSPSNGVLEPYGAALLSCSLNAAATNLPAGAYATELVLSNDTFGAHESLPLLFMISQLVQNGGFETGDWTGWTFTGNTNFTYVTNNSMVAHSGAYGLRLGEKGGLAYLAQAIPTVPGASYSLSLWLDSPDGQTPNEFSVSWGGQTLCDDIALPAIGWTNLQFTVSALETSTVLKLGFRDDPSYLGLDDISVTAAPPAIGSVTPASGPVAGGTTVAISGAGFQSHATVAFGSLPAASVLFNAASNLTVVTPAGVAGPVNVAITNADGQWAVLTNGFVFIGLPVITWPNPPAVTYGAALGPSQLNATANVPGVFAYNPPAGTVLNSGACTLSALFTPNDTVDYSSVTNSVSLVVSLAPLSVTAANASRPYGQAAPAFTGTMTGLQNGDNITATYRCSATSGSPVGAYAIVPALVDPGDRLTNYTVSLLNGVLTVVQAIPLVTWANPAPITYGAPLTTNQLNATASVPGSFAYNPTNGAALNAGTNALSVIFSPTDTVDYSSVTNSVSLVVSLAPLSVTASNASRLYGLANPVFTGTIAGLQNADAITASYSCNATSASPAGTYPIVPVLVDPGSRATNYQVSFIDGTLTVLAPALPVFQTITLNADTAVFSWSAAPGEAYQVQSASSLATANWADLGGLLTATNATLTATDSITASQCFYRVLLVPQ